MLRIRRYGLLTALFLITFVTAQAQIGEERRTISVGFNGGVSMNTVGFDPTITQKQHIATTFGVTLRMMSEKYFNTYCALQVELNYAQLGWNEDIHNSNDEPLEDTYQRHMNYVQLPIFARLAWGREHRGLMGYFMAGPQIGYAFSETTERSETWTLDSNGNPDRPNSRYVQYSMPLEKKFDYGITGGAGIELNTKIGHFMIDGRYYYGLSDLFGNSKSDPFARSNNNTITVKFTYLIDIRK